MNNKSNDQSEGKSVKPDRRVKVRRQIKGPEYDTTDDFFERRDDRDRRKNPKR